MYKNGQVDRPRLVFCLRRFSVMRLGRSFPGRNGSLHHSTRMLATRKMCSCLVCSLDLDRAKRRRAAEFNANLWGPVKRCVAIHITFGQCTSERSDELDDSIEAMLLRRVRGVLCRGKTFLSVAVQDRYGAPDVDSLFGSLRRHVCKQQVNGLTPEQVGVCLYIDEYVKVERRQDSTLFITKMAPFNKYCQPGASRAPPSSRIFRPDMSNAPLPRDRGSYGRYPCACPVALF